MSRRRKVLLTISVAGLVLVAGLALWVLPLFVGPALPAGATRLHITTAGPNLTLGCAAALLSPVRVATSDDELTLVYVESGTEAKVVWPSGFAAWRVGGRSVVADPWGNVVGREGGVLDSLSGGEGSDDAFHICPYGIVTER
jgi:hypothetical protein